MDSVTVEVKGHVTMVRFWGSPERGATAVNIKQVSVWGALVHPFTGNHIVRWK